VRRGRGSILVRALFLGTALRSTAPFIAFVCSTVLSSRCSRTALAASSYDEVQDGDKVTSYDEVPVGDKITSYDEVQVGDKITGNVRRVVDFGAFVLFGDGLTGLLRDYDISSSDRVNDARDLLEVGQEVQVWVKEKRDGKISLTGVENRVKFDLSPFEGIASDQWLKGTVLATPAFGAFVKVTEPNSGATAIGLVNKMNIKWGFLKSVEDELEIAQEVNVKILSVDAGKLYLSMLKEAAAQNFSLESIPSDQWLTGRVVSTTSEGAHMEVRAPNGDATAKGFVHITHIKDGYVAKVKDEVHVGQEVQVRVLRADKRKGFLLSMKP